MQKTKWTKELPTNPGVYWWTPDKEKSIPVIIYETESGYIFAAYTNGRCHINSFPDGWWTTKPILPPEVLGGKTNR